MEVTRENPNWEILTSRTWSTLSTCTSRYLESTLYKLTFTLPMANRAWHIHADYTNFYNQSHKENDLVKATHHHHHHRPVLTRSCYGSHISSAVNVLNDSTMHNHAACGTASESLIQRDKYCWAWSEEAYLKLLRFRSKAVQKYSESLWVMLRQSHFRSALGEHSSPLLRWLCRTVLVRIL